jgi:ClpP class serine protease
LASAPKSNLKFLAVIVNSGGGAPAQCHILKTKLKLWSEEKNIPVYTFAEDAATSGGYYVLTAGKSQRLL